MNYAKPARALSLALALIRNGTEKYAMFFYILASDASEFLN